MSKQPPPAPTASAIGPCPTSIQISRTPRHCKFTQHLRSTRPPSPGIEPRTSDLLVRCPTDCATRPGSFIIDVQLQGQYQQWTPFQVTGLLHAWQISHQIFRCIYHEGRYLGASTLCKPSLSAASKSSWASQAHAFHQPLCQRLS